MSTPHHVRTPVLPAGDVPDLTEPAAPAHAAAASRTGSGSANVSSANPAPAAAQGPVVRQPVPRDARPAVNARSIGGPGASAPAASVPVAPFSVALMVQPESGLQDLGQAVVNGLSQVGVTARLATLPDAGRPDVILALNSVAGARNEAWFCDPGPEQSGVLAHDLLDAIGPGERSAAPAEGPQSDFPCEEIHAGRASVPAVLLELAAAGPASDADVIVSSLDAFFRQQRSQVLAARSAPRLIWPAQGPVTSHYGPSHPLGIDIGQSTGPIVAATDGVIAFAGGNACCSYGLYVVIEGADGIGTLYGHLSSIAVAQGQRVRQGQVLGQVGCTGTCFGTHLHFEVFDSDRRQNPMRYLP